ncbi:hypothetical protein FGO68_gene11167 [Halteria grandinella]|uniref:Uncharacterized protein n=1 Tax=Halteria grandinella TaxID=5974 RepID=A0A8J8NV01_HALGN|nr:hypothetical protein FGO68_gene11167 [Halteria grandinella]
MGGACTKPTESKKEAVNTGSIEKRGDEGQVNAVQEDKPAMKKMEKVDKKGQVTNAQLDFHVNLGRVQMAELAYTNESKFIKLCKEHNITRFAQFGGYSIPDHDSEGWSLLLLALATNRMELAQFIVERSRESFEEMVRYQGMRVYSEAMESHPHDMELKVLFTEDAQQGFKFYLQHTQDLHMNKARRFHYLSYILQSSAPTPDSHCKFLETILQSDPFRILYAKMVTSLTRNKDSFRSFYEQLIDVFVRDKKKNTTLFGEMLSKQLSQPPYNVAFGAFLIECKPKLGGVFGLSLDPLISKCANDMRDCDFWRIGKFSVIDQKELEKAIAKNFTASNASCAQYIEALKKMEGKRAAYEQKLQTLLYKVVKNDVGWLKSHASEIPRWCYHYIKGYDGELVVNGQPYLVENMEEVSVGVLASMFGADKVLKYLFEELKLVNPEFLGMQSLHRSGIVQPLSTFDFITIPILKKDMATLQVILNSTDHFRNHTYYMQLMVLLKLANWPQGIMALIQSNQTKDLLSQASSPKAQMYHIYLLINSPFAVTTVYNDPTQFVERDDGDKMPWEHKQVQSRQTFGSFKGMSTEDKNMLRVAIREHFSVSANSCAGTFFQDLCKKTGKFTESFPTEMPQEDTRTVIQSMRKCLKHMDDIEIIPYIREAGNDIVEYLTEYQESLKTGDYRDETEFISEIGAFCNRIKAHPMFEKQRKTRVFGSDRNETFFEMSSDYYY